ncbi:MAG: TIGR02301 family protein [Hyphomicrobiaceae bacterium]|nr:MAG: TIGR02301 family protein [Hyphomicrobiaceae bacterium]
MLAMLCALALQAGPAHAQADSRPYDEKLMRLSELLGAIHYLRELCGASDGQLWRDRMRELIDADGAGSALRRSRLTKSFNNGYRSYRRSYQTCSPTAQATLNKFMAEGLELSEALAVQQ